MTDSFLDESIAILSRTPGALDGLLRGLPDVWTNATGGAGTWSPYTVVGHLNHGERTDWMPRLTSILEQGESRAFEPFDREAQFQESAGKSLGTLLDEFQELRRGNLERLRGLRLTEADLQKRGTHPEFGPVTVRQLLATWTAHD